jgi:hypothetical protein
VLAENPDFRVSFRSDLLNGVNTLTFNANVLEVDGAGRSVSTVKKQLTAIPYYSWNNRGPNEMQVWLPTKIGKVQVNP